MKIIKLLAIFLFPLLAYCASYQKNCDQFCFEVGTEKVLTAGEYSDFLLKVASVTPGDRIQLKKVFLWMIMDKNDQTPCEKGSPGSGNHGTRPPLWEAGKEELSYHVSKVWFLMEGPWQVCAQFQSELYGEKYLYIDINVAPQRK
jgi:mannose-6-phosphate isomerase-like protein (cupin superfamily)